MITNPLLKKLRLPAGGRAAFVNAPPGYVESLGLPAGVAITDTVDARCDFAQIFVRDSGELAVVIDGVLGQVRPDCVLWFCYPKQSSGVPSDLTRDEGWAALSAAGWRGIASVAIDAVWSGVRFRPGSIDGGAAGIDAQYAGGKAALRPIFDRLRPIVESFGDDVELAVRQSYVAFARGKQFAVVQPSTNSRVDVGLRLPGTAAAGRLEASRNVGGGSITHKVALSTAGEVDDELIGWLRAAYEGVA
jgi:predicted transport protein